MAIRRTQRKIETNRRQRIPRRIPVIESFAWFYEALILSNDRKIVFTGGYTLLLTRHLLILRKNKAVQSSTVFWTKNSHANAISIFYAETIMRAVACMGEYFAHIKLITSFILNGSTLVKISVLHLVSWARNVLCFSTLKIEEFKHKNSSQN